MSEHWFPCGADGRAMYGHVITKFSGMGRFTYPWCSAGALRAPELRYKAGPRMDPCRTPCVDLRIPDISEPNRRYCRRSCIFACLGGTKKTTFKQKEEEA